MYNGWPEIQESPMAGRIQAGTLKAPVACEKSVDERFVKAAPMAP